MDRVALACVHLKRLVKAFHKPYLTFTRLLTHVRWLEFARGKKEACQMLELSKFWCSQVHQTGGGGRGSHVPNSF
jgi:hypothetical protein